jgi:large subunit ribosomal protein L22
LVKGKRAEDAIAILYTVKKKASGYGIDLLKSAIDNAKRNVQGIDTSTLYISKLVADPGPMLKRFRAASMGRAGSIHKHTSHLTIELDTIKDKAAHEAVESKAAAEKSKPKKAKASPAPKKEAKEKAPAHKDKKAHKSETEKRK